MRFLSLITLLFSFPTTYAIYLPANQYISLPFNAYTFSQQLDPIVGLPDQHFYRVTTSFGFSAELAGRTKLLKNNEKVPIEELKIGDQIQINPFIGVAYEDPPDIVIVDEQKILDSLTTLSILSPNRRKNVMNKLHEFKLLPLKLNDSRFPLLIKLFGFLLSESRFFLTKEFEPRININAREEIIDHIQQDLTELSFPSSKFLKIEPFRHTENFYSLTETSTSCRLQISSSAATILFFALGLPLGRRGEQKLEIPSWILENATPWQQALFLSTYLGCRMATPTAKTKYNFNGIFIQLSQRLPYAEYGIEFQEQLRSLLNLFGIETGNVLWYDDFTTPNTIRIRFKINENSENLMRLFSTFSFEYHPQKQMYAHLANCYLRYKSSFTARSRPIHETNFPTIAEFFNNYKSKDGLIHDEIIAIEPINHRSFHYFHHQSSPQIINNFVVANE